MVNIWQSLNAEANIDYQNNRKFSCQVAAFRKASVSS